MDESFIFITSMLNIINVSIFIFILKLLPFLQITDLIFKILFKSNSLYFSAKLQTIPIFKIERSIYIILENVFTFWNFYLIVFFLPYLYKFASINEAIIIISLLWFVLIINNGISLWVKNYITNSLIKSFFICISYLFLLWGEYLFFSEIQQKNTLMFVLFLPFLALLSLIIYHLIFSQKKIYNENLINKTFDYHKKITSLSFLKMELIYILRSKRLLILLLFPMVFFLILIFSGMGGDINAIKFFMFFFLFLPTMSLGQYIFGIEANFFNGIWTKPILLIQIFENKYIFYMLLTGLYSLFLFPFIIIYRINIYLFISETLYVVFFFNLLLFPMALFSKKLDMDKAALFMNYQGFALIPFVYEIILFFFSLWFFQFIYSSFNNEWIALSILSFISIASFFLRKYFLSFITVCFLKRRYENMNRYMSS
jgi:hypothetical protein